MMAIGGRLVLADHLILLIFMRFGFQNFAK